MGYDRDVNTHVSCPGLWSTAPLITTVKHSEPSHPKHLPFSKSTTFSLKDTDGGRWGLHGTVHRKPHKNPFRHLYSPQSFPLISQSVQSLSHVRLCDPMNHSVPGLPVHHQPLEFTQTQVHQVSDAIQPSHSLLSPSPAPNPSQHQALFKRVNSSHHVAKVLEFQLQHQSFQWTPRADLLQDGLVGSPCSPRDSQESSPIPQFKSIDFLALSFLHSPTLTSIHDHWKNHSLD